MQATVEDIQEMFTIPRNNNFILTQEYIKIHVILEEILNTSPAKPQQEKDFYKSVQTMAVFVMKILDDASYNAISNVVLKYKIDHPEKIELARVIIGIDGISLGYDAATSQQRSQKKVIERFLNLAHLSEFISRLDVNRVFSRTFTLASAYKEIHSIYEFMSVLIAGIDTDTYSMKIIELVNRKTDLSEEEIQRIGGYANQVDITPYEDAKDAPDVLRMKIAELEKVSATEKKKPPSKLQRRVSTNDMLEDKSQDTPGKPKTGRRKSAPAVSDVDPIKTLNYNVRNGIAACKTSGKYLGQTFRKLYRNEFIYNPEQKELKKQLSDMGLRINAEVVEAFERIEMEFLGIKAGTPYSKEDGVKLADLDQRILNLRGKISGFSAEIEAEQKKIPPKFVAVVTSPVVVMAAARKVTLHKNRLPPEVQPPSETQLEILRRLTEKRHQREIRRSKR
jgi:hypothetical protein